MGPKTWGVMTDLAQREHRYSTSTAPKFDASTTRDFPELTTPKNGNPTTRSEAIQTGSATHNEAASSFSNVLRSPEKNPSSSRAVRKIEARTVAENLDDTSHRIQLTRDHPWASQELCEAILSSVQNDLSAAQSAMEEMSDKPSTSDTEDDHDRLAPQNNAYPVWSSHSKQQDVYFKYRRDAIKLSHAWRKKIKRAALAFGADQHGEGHQLAAEAGELMKEIRNANADASHKIEAENNPHRPDWEWILDLHGLHADEAVAALQRRLDLLSGLIYKQYNLTVSEEVRKQTPQTGAQPTSSFNSQRPDHGAHTSFLKLSPRARSKVLSVIVGKGRHSSLEEPVLPRVIKAFLTEHKYNYICREGDINVHLNVPPQSRIMS